MLNKAKFTSKTNPFILKVGKAYKDELSNVNEVELQTRWFKFNVQNSGIYKLIYSLNENENNNIYPEKPNNIIYKLIIKKRMGN